jgi:glycosyltransferase involved in cell wall biosynthesis
MDMGTESDGYRGALGAEADRPGLCRIVPGKTASAPDLDGIVFVADLGAGSMATCSRHLARELGVKILYTHAYERAAQLEGVALLDPRSARGLMRDLGFVRSLRRIGGVVHLSNHHLARYGSFLRCPYIVTVHDLIRLRDMNQASQRIPLIRRPSSRDRMLYRLDHQAIRRAAALIATSEATRGDLIRLLGIAPERVTVIHNGIDQQRFHPTEKMVARKPYILFVGVEHPRKNLISLLHAFRRLKEEPRFQNLRLIKVGAPGYRGKAFRQQTLSAITELGLRDEVELVGPVEGEKLASYYSGAECLVMPSLAEGFGLPVIEAMACGCPVIVSDRDSLPEIAANAATVTGPDAEAIAEALRNLIGNQRVREDLRRRGLQHAGQFTWAAAAARTRAVYRAVLRRLGPNRADRAQAASSTRSEV